MEGRLQALYPAASNCPAGATFSQPHLRQVLWNLDQLVSRVKALLTIGAEWGKAGANSFADREPGDARTQLLDLANSFETDDNRRIAHDHRVRDTCSMVRVSEIHADGRAAKTYLAAPGRPDLNLLPHEVVGCAFLVDYRRHSHDAFLLLQPFLLRGSQLSHANSLAHAELSSIDMLPVSAIGLGRVAAANLGEVAALVGDTGRRTMLNALIVGQSLTATDAAYCGRDVRSTATRQ